MRAIQILTLAGLLIAPASAFGSKTWSRTFQAGGHPTVRVKTEDARVEVRAHDAKTVDVRVEAIGGVSGFSIGTLTPKVRIEERDGVIEVEVETHGVTAGLTISSLHYEVDIAVPPGCDLEAHTSDGSLTVDGLRGHVGVNSSDGHVTLTDLKGDVSIRTSDGPVVAEGIDGRLEGTTADGTLRVKGRFDDLALQSTDGGMEVEVAPGSTLSDGWSLSTTDCGLRLVLPSALKLTLDARVRDGSLDVDLDTGSSIQASDLHAVRMDLNGGGPVLKIRTSDGSVRIRGGS